MSRYMMLAIARLCLFWMVNITSEITIHGIFSDILSSDMAMAKYNLIQEKHIFSKQL